MQTPIAQVNIALTTARERAEAASDQAPHYAEVAIPLHIRQTFTYRLPLALQRDAHLGSRLLVPFGRKRLTGYIVALLDALDPAADLKEEEIKDAEELLDAEPLLTPEILEITRWVALYYAAPWGEVLKAALPAGLNATIEQVLSITPEGRDELARLPISRTATAKARALRLVADEAGAFQQPQVAGDGGPADRQLVGQLLHRGRVAGEQLEDGAAGRVTQRAECVQLVSRHER